MSFNLNKLVQPECGGTNPLVASAQQIATRSGVSGLKVAGSSQPQVKHMVNFSNEFIQQSNSDQQQRPQSGFMVSQLNQPSQLGMQDIGFRAGTSMQMTGSGKLASDYLVEHELQAEHNQQNNLQNTSISNSSLAQLPRMMSNMMIKQSQFSGSRLSNNTTLAGDQLEAKYRDDIMASTSTQESSQNTTEKTDDIEFWRALSQKYVGPSTMDTNQKATELQMSSQEQEDKLSTLEELIVDDMQTGDVTETTESITMKRKRLDEYDLEYLFDDRNPLKDQFEDPFAEGLKKLEIGDIPSAALLFEAAVVRDPENSLAWRYLGTTQAQNEKDNQAIRALKNCLKRDEKDQEARLAISVSLANETRQHEACRHLLEWLINHEKYQSLGVSLEKFFQYDHFISNDPYYINSVDQKHYNYVKEKFVEAARMSPNNPDPEVQSSLGVLFNMQGEYEWAVDCFKAALSVRSDDSILWNRLGATLANGNKSDEAVVAYRKALEISPGFLRSRYNLAISLIHLNTYGEAAKQLVQILNMQASGKGSKNTQIRTRSITSTAIWSTLRTVATLMNKPELYPMIDGRDLAKCNDLIFNLNSTNSN